MLGQHISERRVDVTKILPIPQDSGPLFGGRRRPGRRGQRRLGRSIPDPTVAFLGEVHVLGLDSEGAGDRIILKKGTSGGLKASEHRLLPGDRVLLHFQVAGSHGEMECEVTETRSQNDVLRPLDHIVEEDGLKVELVELLRDKVRDEEFTGAVLTYMASILEGRRVSYCFTGSHGLSASEVDEWRRLLGKAAFEEVTFLSEEDTYRLIKEPVGDRVDYGDGVLNEIYRLTHGHPFYTQVICSNIVDYLNGELRNSFSLEDLEDVLRTIVDNPPPQMTYAWDERSRDEQIVLSLLSEQSQDADMAVTVNELTAAIKANNYPVSLTSDAMHVALESLFNGRVLNRTEADGYYFRVDLFRLWIRRSRTIWRLVGDTGPRKASKRKPFAAAAAVLALFAVVGYWMVSASEQEAERIRALEEEAMSQASAGVPTGDIWVEEYPAGSEIWLDGRRRPEGTPTGLPNLEPGIHVVEIRHPDYRTLIESVTVEAGMFDTVRTQTLRRTGILALKVNRQDATVRVRGGDVDTTVQAPFADLPLPTGKYSVDASEGILFASEGRGYIGCGSLEPGFGSLRRRWTSHGEDRTERCGDSSGR